jgi:hypothetical protein
VGSTELSKDTYLLVCRKKRERRKREEEREGERGVRLCN